MEQRIVLMKCSSFGIMKYQSNFIREERPIYTCHLIRNSSDAVFSHLRLKISMNIITSFLDENSPLK
jgi:hypothetical protein